MCRRHSTLRGTALDRPGRHRRTWRSLDWTWRSLDWTWSFAGRIDFTRRRAKFRSVGFLLEGRAEKEGLIEVCRIFDDARHHDPLIAVRLVVSIEVLGEHGLFAVGHAVLAKV